MTTNRTHPALINNDDTIFDLSTEETTSLINEYTNILAQRLAYVMTWTSDSHIDDFFMIQAILTKMMPVTGYHESDMTPEQYSAALDTAFDDTTLNDIFYHEFYNNATLISTPKIFKHFNELTEDQVDNMLND